MLSVDTRRASVAAQALSAGADVINDVSGGRFDPRMHQSVKDFDASMVCTTIPDYTTIYNTDIKYRCICTCGEHLKQCFY